MITIDASSGSLVPQSSSRQTCNIVPRRASMPSSARCLKTRSSRPFREAQPCEKAGAPTPGWVRLKKNQMANNGRFNSWTIPFLLHRYPDPSSRFPFGNVSPRRQQSPVPPYFDHKCIKDYNSAKYGVPGGFFTNCPILEVDSGLIANPYF